MLAVALSGQTAESQSTRGAVTLNAWGALSVERPTSPGNGSFTGTKKASYKLDQGAEDPPSARTLSPWAVGLPCTDGSSFYRCVILRSWHSRMVL